MLLEHLEHGDKECTGFAGPSSRHCHDIATTQDKRDHTALDGRGHAVALGFDAPIYRVLQAFVLIMGLFGV